MFLEEIYSSEPRFFVVMLARFLVFCVAGRLGERKRKPTGHDGAQEKEN